MKQVALQYCTRTSRLLSRIVESAASDLATRTHGIPRAPIGGFQIHGSADALRRVAACDEVSGGLVPDERPQRVFGYSVLVDKDIRPDQIWIVDPKSGLNSVIEVL